MKKYVLLCLGLFPILTFGQIPITPATDDADATAGQPMKKDIEGFNHSEMYQLKPAIDIPIISVGTVWSAYAFSKIYSKDPIPVETVAALDRKNINVIDRWAAGKSDKKMDANSNYLFYGSIPLPALLFIDKRMRHDAGKISLLYWESFAITGLLYTGSTYFIDRYRPETYDTRNPASERVNGNYKNAFFAGHVAVTANATFFMAKIYSDYHPHSNWKWVFWGGAAAATGTMIYMRHEAGKHFPTDLLVGTAVGTLSGILVPQLHKNPNRSWSVMPSVNPYTGKGVGFAFNYSLR